MKKIAIIFGSIKPYDSSARLVVDSILATFPKRDKYTYDIFISGFEKPDDDRIIWTEDTIKNGELPALNALTQTALEAGYDYFVIFSDDYKIAEGSVVDAVEFISGPAFANKKYKICTLATTTEGPCQFEGYLPFPEGSPNGIGIVCNVSHSIICRFPVLDRQTLIGFKGNIFHPDLLSGYADSYLGYYLNLNGEPCVEFSSVKLQFMDHIHQFDAVSRKTEKWIKNRSETCETSSKLIINLKAGEPYSK